MKNLQKFIDDQNRWNALLGGDEITLPLSQANIQSIASSIESGLSPENLACDGEASAAHIRRTGKYLNAAKNDLAKLTGLTFVELETLAWGEWA